MLYCRYSFRDTLPSSALVSFAHEETQVSQLSEGEKLFEESGQERLAGSSGVSEYQRMPQRLDVGSHTLHSVGKGLFTLKVSSFYLVASNYCDIITTSP